MTAMMVVTTNPTTTGIRFRRATSKVNITNRRGRQQSPGNQGTSAHPNGRDLA